MEKLSFHFWGGGWNWLSICDFCLKFVFFCFFYYHYYFIYSFPTFPKSNFSQRYCGVFTTGFSLIRTLESLGSISLTFSLGNWIYNTFTCIQADRCFYIYIYIYIYIYMCVCVCVCVCVRLYIYIYIYIPI